MADDPKYITRLMRIRCSKGTMDNYINVGTDHGVLAGPDLLPVLNANDHTEENIIHCGNCESDENPERMFRKALVSSSMGVIGLLAGDMVTDFLEDVGIMTCKCKPNTPVPWLFTNEHNILEGAPALTMNSKVACRYGGIIEFVPLDEYPTELSAPQEPEAMAETAEENLKEH
ncbi:MAG: PAAR-like protein [Lachnospiraceae bacterium]